MVPHSRIADTFSLVVRIFRAVFGVYRCEATAGFSLSVRAFDSQSTEVSIVIFHRSNSCWQPLCVILFT